MKPILHLIPLFSAAASLSALAAEIPTTAFILGDLPDASTPTTTKPGFTAKAADILTTQVHHQGGRTITLSATATGATGETVTFFSSADFGLLASIGTFTGTDGKNRSLILSWSVEPCENTTDLTTRPPSHRARPAQSRSRPQIHPPPLQNLTLNHWQTTTTPAPKKGGTP